MDIKVGVVNDEQLLREMFKLRIHLRTTIGRFLTGLPENSKLDDLSIGSVLLELGCEIYDICDVPKDDFMKIIEGQFDITRERLAMLQAECAGKQ
jgi:hypothetical protein